MAFKPFADGSLSEMSERRIADVVDQPGALENRTHILLVLFRKAGIQAFLKNLLSYTVAERMRERRYFQRMRQPCADKIALIQREHLCLILKASE